MTLRLRPGRQVSQRFSWLIWLLSTRFAATVLAQVAYALPTQTREERASRAKVRIRANFAEKQREFLDFVLAHYMSGGVRELDQEKLTPLLRLKYHDSIPDAVDDLGQPEEIRAAFAGFQKYLYQPAA
jgi:type I restriction enzyme R subunit